MGINDETPMEKQERLERHEELMQKREERLSNRTRPNLDGSGVKGSSSVGSGLGDFFGAIGDHKLMIFGGIGAIVVAIIVYNMVKNNSSSAAQNANLGPNYANGGYIPSDLSTSLDSINSQLSAQGAQIGDLVNNQPQQGVQNNSFAFPAGGQVVPGGVDINGQRWWDKLAGGAQELFYLPVGSQVWQGSNGNWWYRTPGGQQALLNGQMVTLTQNQSGTLVLSGISQTSGVLPKLNVNTNVNLQNA